MDIPIENIKNSDIPEIKNIEEPKKDNVVDTKEDIVLDTKEDIEDIEDKKEENILVDYDTLVLSGGSSKGIMTLGALQYLYDNFLLKNIKNYIGTSAGAMICYLLAIGYTPVEIIVYICKHQLLEKMQHFIF